MIQQIIGPAIDRLGSDNMVAGTSNVLKSVSDGGCARSDGKGGHSAFQCGETFFQYILGRVG